MRKAVAAAICLVLASGAAWAKDVVVVCSTGLQPTLEALRPRYEAHSGDRLVITFETPEMLMARLDAGAPFDLAVLTPGLISGLVKQGRVIEGSARTVAEAGDPAAEATQPYAVLMAGLSAAATDRVRAAALLSFLRGPEAITVIRAMGLVPGS